MEHKMDLLFGGQHHNECPRHHNAVDVNNWFGGGGGGDPFDDGSGGDGGGGDGAGNGGGGGRPGPGLDAVGGLDDHINVLRNSIIYPLQHPGKLQEWGVEPPKGIMFYGPPGTGKTLLAKALANELGTILGKPVHFIYHKGTESHSMWFGEAERTLRDLFKTAAAKKPSLIFFDEIDGLCPNRDSASTHGSQAYASVVTALLGLIDSVRRGDVFIIGATNRLDAVDPAIKRPGRFDKELYFALPNEDGRKKIIQIHTSNWLQDKPESSLLTNIASRTQGFTGADLEKLCTDTLQAAFSRSLKIKKSLKCPCDVNVLEEDWNTAFASMHRSRPNVFGSTLHITEPLSPILLPLIHFQFQEILATLKPLLPTALESGGYLSYLEANGRSLSGNNFLFWDKGSDSEQFLNHLLMQGLLSHTSINEIPTYILDESTIKRRLAVERGSSIDVIIERIIGQVEGSTKPCILYAPNLDRTMTMIQQITKDKSVSEIWKQLDRIKGTNHLLLATLLAPTTMSTCEEFQVLFRPDVIWMVRQPSCEERCLFFKQIFDKEQNNPEMKAQLNKIVRITKGNSLDEILQLFGRINSNSECKIYKDRLNLYKKTIADYQQRI